MPTIHSIRVQGMHCASCGLLIDDALADLPGVRASRTSFRSGLSTVEVSGGTPSLADILAAITQLGYTATAIGASPADGGR